MLKRIKNAITSRLFALLDNIRYGSMGKHSRVIKPMRIIGKKRIFIGDNVTVLNYVRMETISTWGEGVQLNGVLSIGDGTSFEQGCHIIAAKDVRIGNDCVFSAYVYISDCSHDYSPEKSIIQSALDIKPVRIGNHCFVGIGSCIMPGVTLGDNVVIGANSVVTRDIPANCMAVGSPAKVIKRYDAEQREWLRL